MKRFRKWVLIGIPVALLAAAGAVLVSIEESYRGFEGETFVKVERGRGVRSIAHTLAGAGVIRSEWQLLAVRALHPSAKLQAGEYRFSDPATVSQVFGRISRGDVYYFEFTVPEGSNIFDIAQALESARVVSSADFLKVAEDPASIRGLAPKARSLEGYLFPSTYRLTHSTSAAELCRMMTAEFRRQWKKLDPSHAADVHRTVTLASLVEKETGVAAERPLVAGVFTNRLEKGVRLGCDPTTIYAALLENRYRGAIHRSDLKSGNPYNTYQHEGLPPGPIANPGAHSIEAALHPAKTNHLYFVAKPGGGGHVFSDTLAEHDQAVKQYRGATSKPPAKQNKNASKGHR